MRFLKTPLAFIFSFLFIAHSAATEDGYISSEPLKMSDQGIFHTLVMHDSTTILLHLQRHKEIELYVFDKAKKRTVTGKDLSVNLDVNALESFVFHGFYEVNGAPVLFAEQVVNLRKSIFRIRFDPLTGKIKEEAILDQSNPQKQKIGYLFVFSTSHQSYAVVQRTKLIDLSDSAAFSVSIWNNEHKKIKEVSIPFGGKIEHIGSVFCIGTHMNEENELMLVFSMESPNGVEKSALFARLKSGDTSFSYLTTVLGNKYDPYSSEILQNRGKYSVLLLTNAKNDLRETLSVCFYLEIDKPSFSVTLVKRVANNYCTANKPNKKDSTEIYEGIPARLGGIDSNIYVLSRDGVYNYNNSAWFMHNNRSLCVVKLDEKGRELNGDFIPVYQNTSGSISPYELRYSNVAIYGKDNNLAVVFNDEDKGGKAMFDYQRSEAVCYKVLADGSVRKKNLFGDRTGNTHRCVMINGGDYNSSIDLYASLVSVTTDGKTQLYMGWGQLK